MTQLELKERLVSLKDELRNIMDNGQKEQRELVENETNRMAEIRTEIDAVEKEIADIDAENAAIAKNNRNNKTENTNKKMEIRLFDLIKGIAEGNLTDEQRAFVNGNSINYRGAIQATAEEAGKENVPTYKQPLEMAIRNASVLSKLGNRHFANAVGDIKLPKYSGSNAVWADSENGDSTDGAGKFSEVTLSPKRLTAYLTISRQFLAQSPEDAEAMLIADLAKAVAEKIDMTVFGAESGVTGQPDGIFAGVAAGDDLTGVTFQDILDLEAEVEAHNGTDFVFVTDPKVKYALRGTQMASGLQMVWENNEIDGRKAVVSNSVNAKSVLCFDPQDLATASWGDGMSIIVDPYTLAGNNQIKVTVNYLFDAKVKGDRIAKVIFA